MARDIRTKAHLQGGEIRTKANFGQTVAITVLPDPYEGATTITPSDERQTLPTRGKTVATDITVLPAPVESLATSENGTFVPSSGNVGFSEVVVDVEPSLESLSVTENGLYLPESGVDGFDEVVVAVPTGGGGGLTLIDTIEVNGVRGVQVDIDASWFDDADYVVLVPDLTFSTSDWLYIVADATSGGNDYAPRATSVGISQGVTLGMVSGHVVGAWFKDGTNRPSAYTPQSYLYWYMYYASTTMTGTIKIYGIKIPT